MKKVLNYLKKYVLQESNEEIYFKNFPVSPHLHDLCKHYRTWSFQYNRDNAYRWNVFSSSVTKRKCHKSRFRTFKFKSVLNSVSTTCTCNASINSSGAHPPPGQPWGICSRCQSRVWGIRNFIAAPGLGISIPRGDLWAFDTRVFEIEIGFFIGKDEAFVKDWLVHQGLEKLVDVLKVCFLKFRYFFITCKHINISDKVNHILFITKQSLM